MDERAWTMSNCWTLRFYKHSLRWGRLQLSLASLVHKVPAPITALLLYPQSITTEYSQQLTAPYMSNYVN
jgi:hypothetical protein